MTKILVAYASWKGTSEEVAGEIAKALREQGAQADVEAARKVRDVAGYDGVVLGASVRIGNPHPAARGFMRRHAARLASIPTALFVVCMTMKENTEENIKTAQGYVEKVRSGAPAVQPVAEGLFAGRWVPEIFPWPVSKMMKKMEGAGDYRDWDAIRAWAASLTGKFSK